VNLLVCDDDPLLRGVVSELAASHGHVVVAEVATSREAVDWLHRGGIDVVVVDLSLQYGSGIDVVEAAARLSVDVVVLTAFADAVDGDALPGRPPVVPKADLASFEGVLAELGRARDRDAAERREATSRRDTVRLPGGVDDARVFYDVLSRAAAGDVLMAVDLETPDELDVARLVAIARAAVRMEDRVMRTSTGVLLLLLRGSGDPTPHVGARLLRAWAERRDGQPLLTRSVEVGDGEEPTDALERLRNGPPASSALAS
jgi:CheY-like chemotaxis protein